MFFVGRFGLLRRFNRVLFDNVYRRSFGKKLENSIRLVQESRLFDSVACRICGAFVRGGYGFYGFRAYKIDKNRTQIACIKTL